MGTLTTRPVVRVSARPLPQVAEFIRSTLAYDYAIGGIPFLSGVSKERLIERKTAPYRKDQFDASAEPGEQSLVTWWLRSQSSFHAGAGIKFEEPTPQDETIQYRFADSAGVDVWTPGQVTLLKQTNLNKSGTGNILLLGCVDGNGADMYLQAEGATLSRVVSGSSTAVTWGGTGTILSMAQDGTNYYVADSTGIYKGTLAGGAGAKIWNTGNASVVLGFVKQRLVAGIGNAVYELDAGGVGGPALPAAKYTHPNTGWVWTSVSETPNAILVAGYAGANSAVYKFILDTSGSVPTLTSGITTAVMPSGERVHCVYGYLGTYVGLGTSKGVRVATVNQSGDLDYGPLIVSTTTPVYDLIGKDRFLFGTYTNGISGNSGLFRIDLATQTAFHRFAYASDLQAHVTGTVRSVQLYGQSGRVVFGVDTHGSYLEDPSVLEATGWFQTGNIRYHTLEPKLFKYIKIRAATLVGSMEVDTVDAQGNVVAAGGYTNTGDTTFDEAAVTTTLGPAEYVAIKFTLNRAVDTTTGPTFYSYQMKALPAAKKQRLIVVPLMCFDHETDKYGATGGTEGSAIARLEALETIEENGDLVLWQDLTRDPAAARLVVIDDIDFKQDVPPKNTGGWGGYIIVTLRAV